MQHQTKITLPKTHHLNYPDSAIMTKLTKFNNIASHRTNFRWQEEKEALWVIESPILRVFRTLAVFVNFIFSQINTTSTYNINL